MTRFYILTMSLLLAATYFGCIKQTPKPALLPDPVAEEAPYREPIGFRLTKSRTNMRSGASTETEIVRTLGADVEVALLDSVVGNWYNVRIGPNEGWIYGSLLKNRPQDRWGDAIALIQDDMSSISVVVGFWTSEGALTVSVDQSWQSMGASAKNQAVSRMSQTWRRAATEAGFEEVPEIRCVTNNGSVLSTWHPFWGIKVLH